MIQHYLTKLIQMKVPVDPDDMDSVVRATSAMKAAGNAAAAHLPAECVIIGKTEMARHKADEPVPTPSVFLSDAGSEGADSHPGDSLEV